MGGKQGNSLQPETEKAHHLPPSRGFSAAYSTSWAAAPLCGWEEGGSHNTFHKLLTAVSSTALYCTLRCGLIVDRQKNKPAHSPFLATWVPPVWTCH